MYIFGGSLYDFGFNWKYATRHTTKKNISMGNS